MEPTVKTLSCSSWATLFGSVSGMFLPFTPPTFVSQKIVVVLPKENVAKGVKVWENSLVRQIIDVKMPYPIIQRLIEKNWDKIEMPTVMILENDLISFQFQKPKSVDWILSCGP